MSVIPIERELRLAEKRTEYDTLAEWFDILYPRSEDFSFYGARVAELGSPVLELGCGTGRLTCSLANTTGKIIGLDLSAKQLERAECRRKLMDPAVASNIEFREGTMTSFSYPERFRLIIIPFSALLELRTSQDRIDTFRHCFAHLTAGGKLIFDNFYRGSGELAAWGKPRPANVVTFWGIHPNSHQGDTEVHHFEVQEYEPDGQMLLTIFIDLVDKSGAVNRRTIRVRRQYVSPEESVCELRAAGFEDVRTYGSFDHHEIGDPAVAGRGRVICEALR